MYRSVDQDQIVSVVGGSVVLRPRGVLQLLLSNESLRMDLKVREGCGSGVVGEHYDEMFVRCRDCKGEQVSSGINASPDIGFHAAAFHHFVPSS
jgi:hypothetical protein